MLQPVSPTQLDQPGLPFTLDDRLAIRAVALAGSFEVSVAMNHPAYFEAAEVFIHGRREVAFVIWRSAIGIVLEDFVGSLKAFVLGLTMSESLEWLTKLARVCNVIDGSEWTDESAIRAIARLH